MRVERVFVTPTVAKQWLELNTGNRKINDRNLEFITNQMNKGLYKETGNTNVKISVTNKLLDGQHTLTSIVKSDKSFYLWVAFDVPDEVFSVLDTGKPRSQGDILAMTGIKNGMGMSSTIGFIKIFQRESSDFGKTHKENAEEKIRFYQANPELEEIYTYTDKVYKKTRWLSPALLAAFYYILMKKNHSETVITRFFDTYMTGLDLTETSPVYILRQKLIKDSTNKTKYRLNDKVALLIVAWNLYIKGRNANGHNMVLPNEFPKII